MHLFQVASNLQPTSVSNHPNEYHLLAADFFLYAIYSTRRASVVIDALSADSTQGLLRAAPLSAPALPMGPNFESIGPTPAFEKRPRG